MRITLDNIYDVGYTIAKHLLNFLDGCYNVANISFIESGMLMNINVPNAKKIRNSITDNAKFPLFKYYLYNEYIQDDTNVYQFKIPRHDFEQLSQGLEIVKNPNTPKINFFIIQSFDISQVPYKNTFVFNKLLKNPCFSYVRKIRLYHSQFREILEIEVYTKYKEDVIDSLVSGFYTDVSSFLVRYKPILAGHIFEINAIFNEEKVDKYTYSPIKGFLDNGPPDILEIDVQPSKNIVNKISSAKVISQSEFSKTETTQKNDISVSHSYIDDPLYIELIKIEKYIRKNNLTDISYLTLGLTETWRIVESFFELKNPDEICKKDIKKALEGLYKACKEEVKRRDNENTLKLKADIMGVEALLLRNINIGGPGQLKAQK